MKTRSREVNVFSMSALDLFASALGAFILISIVLMPYFLRLDHKEVAKLKDALDQAQEERDQAQDELQEERNTTAELRRRLEEAQGDLEQCRQQEAACQEDLGQAQAELAETREDLDQAQSELRQCQANLAVCEEKLSQTFLAIIIQWPTEKHDVDLHMIDPAGNEFFYNKRSFHGQPGELSADTTDGPGVEIWEVPVAPAGKYQVLYNFYDRKGNDEDPTVKGGVYHRDGHERLKARTLTMEGRSKAVLAAVVTVKDDGRVEISEP